MYSFLNIFLQITSLSIIADIQSYSFFFLIDNGIAQYS